MQLAQSQLGYFDPGSSLEMSTCWPHMPHITLLLQTTRGGLLLSSGATKPIQEALIGEVLAVGEDVDIDVKVGTKVLFSKYSSSDVKVPDGDVSFVAQKSILATLS